MTAVLTTLAVIVCLVAAMVAYVAWRDRGRRQALDDSLDERTARAGAAQQRDERRASQGVSWNHGRFEELS